MEEIWKDIKGYEGLYQVSNLGRVKNGKGIILVGEKLKTGYIRYSLKGNRVLGHRIVAQTFIGNPNNLLQVNHIDFNRANNKDFKKNPFSRVFHSYKCRRCNWESINFDE